MDSVILSDRGFLITITILSVVALVGILKIMGKAQEEKRVRTQEVEKQLAQERDIHRELEGLGRLQKLLAHKAEDFEIKYVSSMPHVLSAETLRAFFEFTPSIIDEEELQSIYAINRKARRSIFRSLKSSLGTESGDLETYYRFVCTFQEQIQYLIEKAQKDFVVFLNLDYAVITDSIDYHMSTTNTDLTEWIKNWSLQIKEQLKEKLPLYEKPVAAETIFTIIDYQTECLDADGVRLGEAVASLHLQTEDEQESVPTFLQAYLEDLVFEEFGIEIEQVNLIQQQVTAELKQSLERFAQLRNKVLDLMVSKQVMEESSGEIGDFHIDV